MIIEALMYSITALILINGVAVMTAILVAFRDGQVEHYRKRYWQAMLEQAQRELRENELTEQPNRNRLKV